MGIQRFEFLSVVGSHLPEFEARPEGEEGGRPKTARIAGRGPMHVGKGMAKAPMSVLTRRQPWGVRICRDRLRSATDTGSFDSAELFIGSVCERPILLSHRLLVPIIGWPTIG